LLWLLLLVGNTKFWLTGCGVGGGGVEVKGWILTRSPVMSHGQVIVLAFSTAREEIQSVTI
jgi:hypothetical protein